MSVKVNGIIKESWRFSMYKRIIVSLISLCLLFCSCAQTDTIPIVSDTSAPIAETTPNTIPAQESDAPDDMTCDIPLDFYVVDDNTFDKPDELYSNNSMEMNINIFGRNTLVETYWCKYESDVYDRSFTLFTDTDTNEIYLTVSDYVRIIDIDDDGECEVYSLPDESKYSTKVTYLIDYFDGNIQAANIDDALNLYLSSTLPENTIYRYVTKLAAPPYAMLSYDILSSDPDVYEHYEISPIYTNGGYNIAETYKHCIDRYAPYTSNDTNYTLRVSYNELPSGTDIYMQYVLTITGPDSKKYIYTENDFDGAVTDCDARLDRKLIVHPDLNYAILIYPFSNGFFGDIGGTTFAVINLETGEFIQNPINLYLPLYEDRTIIDETDCFGQAMNYLTCDFTPTDYGFACVAYVRDREGNNIKSTEKELVLNK